VGISPTLFFLVLGILLVVAEVVVPGLVVSFLGAAALLVAGALALGWVGGWAHAFTAWFITSLVMVIGVRSAFTRFLPGQAVKQLTDEDLDAFGEVVEVLEPVSSRGGRIRFRGSTWAAQSLQDILPAGAKAKIVARDNLVWIVEPLDGWAALPDPKETER
jgi:membrane protein implicated in regulation of membrane protease activity